MNHWLSQSKVKVSSQLSLKLLLNPLMKMHGSIIKTPKILKRNNTVEFNSFVALFLPVSGPYSTLRINL